MEFLSHLHPINPPVVISNGTGVLADAFAEFMAASTRLELSYAQLQQEVAHLSRELADRNLKLKASLAENERVHRALQRIVDSMPCGVLVVEEDGSVSMINPESRRLLDLNGSSAEHLDAISIVTGIDLAGFLRRCSSSDREQEFCKMSGVGKRWLSVYDRGPLHGNDSVFPGCRQTILILRDITSHKEAEMAREQGRKAIALSEVAMTLAHEIRNPLASLELFAGLIAAGGSDTDVLVEHLQAGVRLLSGTVSNVLSFHGLDLPCFTPIDLNASIRSSVEFTRPIAFQAGITLTFEAEDSGLWVMGNASALQQVVLNMVTNALRHTGPQGSVRVTVRRAQLLENNQPGLGIVEFSDTGCGIPQNALKDIFQAGYSVSGSSSGLGLAVCTKLIEQHEGAIRVASTVGVGTTFYVEIPAL